MWLIISYRFILYMGVLWLWIGIVSLMTLNWILSLIMNIADNVRRMGRASPRNIAFKCLNLNGCLFMRKQKSIYHNNRATVGARNALSIVYGHDDSGHRSNVTAMKRERNATMEFRCDSWAEKSITELKLKPPSIDSEWTHISSVFTLSFHH